MIPYYFKNHLMNLIEKKDRTIATLVSSTGNTNLDIYYYGELINNKRAPFIIDSNMPCLIVAKDPISNEEFVIFDGAKHGYDAIFCNEKKLDDERKLEKYENFSGELEITFGYSIDYDVKIDEYDFNENGHVKLMYGTMEWNQAKSIGYDWIHLKKGNKILLDIELA